MSKSIYSFIFIFQIKLYFEHDFKNNYNYTELYLIIMVDYTKSNPTSNMVRVCG